MSALSCSRTASRTCRGSAGPRPGGAHGETAARATARPDPHACLGHARAPARPARWPLARAVGGARRGVPCSPPVSVTSRSRRGTRRPDSSSRPSRIAPRPHSTATTATDPGARAGRASRRSCRAPCSARAGSPRPPRLGPVVPVADAEDGEHDPARARATSSSKPITRTSARATGSSVGLLARGSRERVDARRSAAEDAREVHVDRGRRSARPAWRTAARHRSDPLASAASGTIRAIRHRSTA